MEVKRVINNTLFKREIKSNYKIMLIFMALISMYSSVIVLMFDPKLGESLSIMAESMPEIFAAFGMMNAGATLIEFVANYLYGFILIVVPTICIIILGNKLIARYVDKGSMAYLLATPNKRKNIVTTQAIFMAFAILVLVGIAVLISIGVGQIAFPGDLDIKKFLLLNVGLYGLLFFIGGMCRGLGDVYKRQFNDSRYSYGVGGGLAVVFILIQMLSQVGDKLEKLKYLTPLTLFQPDKIIAGDSSAIVYFAVLYIIGLIMYLVGIRIFMKKDFPV